MSYHHLTPVLESFFQEDEGQGNSVTFGMRLKQEDLPEYSS